MMINQVSVSMLALLLISSPSSFAADSAPLPDSFFVQDIDRDLGERFEDDSFAKEREYITDVVQTFSQFARDVKQQTHSTQMRRGAHAKALACLKARFEIQNHNIPSDLRVGLFSEDKKSFNAWVRISNSHQNPFSKGTEQNTRGFAIKLLDVDGKKLMADESHATTHDLLMVAAEAFVARDNKNYSDIADGTEGPLGLIWRLKTKALALIGSVKKVQKEANPLRLDFFSTVPYRLGYAQGPKAAVKFALSLCDGTDVRKFASSKEGEDYLERNIAETIQNVEQVCFDFKMQFAEPGDDVEDATTKWSGEYKTIARLYFDRSANLKENLPGREEFCENLSFTPWHALEQHRPLGRINRARLATYLGSAKLRRDFNRVRSEEPTGRSFDDIR